MIKDSFNLNLNLESESLLEEQQTPPKNEEKRRPLKKKPTITFFKALYTGVASFFTRVDFQLCTLYGKINLGANAPLEYLTASEFSTGFLSLCFFAFL